MNALSSDNPQEIATLSNGKHHDRNIVVPHEGDRRCVHNPKVARKNLVVAQPIVALGARVLFWVRGIDAIDAGALQQGVGIPFPLRAAPPGVSVVKNGAPSPAANITTRPFSQVTQRLGGGCKVHTPRSMELPTVRAC